MTPPGILDENLADTAADQAYFKAKYGVPFQPSVHGLISVEAVFIAVEIDVPSNAAATAMPPPTIARISAYSAAEAPDSSFRKFLIKVMSYIPN
jgi:hypothetical protein